MSFKGAPQIHHIHELNAAFKNGMIVIVREEVPDNMGARKSARLIEWDCQWAVPGPHLQNSVLCAVFLQKKRDERFPIAFTLFFGRNGDVLKFQHALSLIRHNTYSANTVVIAKRIHLSAFQIAVDHVLLLVRQQK